MATTLSKCPSCSREVSSKAASCPHCGHQFKAPGGINLRDPVHLIGIVIIVLFGVGCVLYMLMRVP